MLLVARDRERGAREGLDVHVLDLVPQLDVVDGDVPGEPLAHSAARAHLELPRLLRRELAQVAADLAGRGQLEQQRAARRRGWRCRRPGRWAPPSRRSRPCGVAPKKSDRVRLVAVGQEAIADGVVAHLEPAARHAVKVGTTSSWSSTYIPHVVGDVELVLGLGRRGRREVLELDVDLPGAEELEARGEPVGRAEERRGQHVAQLGAVAVRRVVDDRERQRVVQVLVVELGRPLETWFSPSGVRTVRAPRV